MKNKFINGLLLLAVVLFSCGTFTSCKDNEDDLRAEFGQSDQTLRDLITALQDAQSQCQTSCSTKFTEILALLDGKVDKTVYNQLKADFDALVASLAGHTYTDAQIDAMFAEYLKKSDITQYLGEGETVADFVTGVAEIIDLVKGTNGEGGLVDKVQDLIDNYDDLQDLINNLPAGITKEEVELMIAAAKTEILTQITTLQEAFNLEITNLWTAVNEYDTMFTGLTNRVTTNEEDILDLYYQLGLDRDRITTLETLIGDMEGLGTLADEIRTLKQNLTDLEERLDAKDKELEGKIEALGTDLSEFLTQYALDMEALENRVEANEEAIKELKEDVAELFGYAERFDKLITSMIVQGTYNPLFGTFSLPIGVQSNMLVNYYGTSFNQTFDFPSVQSFATVDNNDQVTADELAVLKASGLEAFTVENGAIFTNNSIGKIFFTVNPTKVDMEGKTFTLVNSRDEKATVELEVAPSDELLTFGYSARSEANGFYEANVKLPATAAAVDGIAFRADAELKSAAKEILKDGRSGLRTNMMYLLKAVYEQFNGALPAYGMKATWTADGEDYSVFSNYNIAATTVKPLSFNFLDDTQTNINLLPVIDPISEAILNIDTEQFKFDFGDVKLELGDGTDVTLNITLQPVEINYDGTLEVSVSGTIDVEGNDYPVTLTGNVSKADMQSFIDQINATINASISGWQNEIDSAFHDAIKQMFEKVDDAVATMLEQMEGEINEKIEDIVESIENEVNNRVGSYINQFNNFLTRYNNIAKRLNNFLKNPNHYLQPTVFYKGGNGLDFFLSTNKDKPSVLNNYGGTGFIVYATSYTAEIFAPAYKKVVAFTNVYDENGNKVADSAAQAQALNESVSYLASVVPGYQKRFGLPTTNMKPGYTYELLYTALDYNGVTATGRYYVSIK